MNIEPERRTLSEFTTLRIGGWTDRFYEIHSRDELLAVLSKLEEPSSAVVLGRGSNTLFPEGEFDRPVLKLKGDFEDSQFSYESVEAGSAVFLPELALEAAGKGFSGLEWAAGVPGTVGGAVAMNAGAFGTETVEPLNKITFVNYEGDISEYTADELEFDYRYCELRDNGIILNVEFELGSADTDSAMEETKSLLRERRNEQPVGTSSAGCVFKNVNGHSAGKLIDEAGLKGVSRGDVQVSEEHANYFVNHGEGTYDQMVDLIAHVRDAVDEEFGYQLETELQIVHEN
jgi:UDP-N-acetylmuramate dehydrogenase